MNIQIQVGDELFRFTSHQQWCDKARSWFKNRNATNYNTVCIDAANRICATGKEFGRARDEETFPVKVYSIEF